MVRFKAISLSIYIYYIVFQLKGLSFRLVGIMTSRDSSVVLRKWPGPVGPSHWLKPQSDSSAHYLIVNQGGEKRGDARCFTVVCFLNSGIGFNNTLLTLRQFIFLENIPSIIVRFNLILKKKVGKKPFTACTFSLFKFHADIERIVNS